MTRLTTLYLDMNAFYASVEQLEHPELIGRPVAIVAVSAKTGACVAASYEAKAYGIKTGTFVQDARQLCPEITFLEARHRLYARYNLAIAALLDEIAELERIRSVDEFQFVLEGPAQTAEGGFALVQQMKQVVARQIGPCIRFSAGLGPNHLLAKIAGKLEKPDGCQWLAPENMPDRIAHLKPDDLPGISKGIMQRLNRAGVWKIEQLYNLDPRHARLIWRSVEGERFVRALQGMNIPLLKTQRNGYGQTKVLSPEYRNIRDAYLVGRWLVEKATARMRRDKRTAGRFSLSVEIIGSRGWSRNLKCSQSQDTGYFLHLHKLLWQELHASTKRVKPMSVSVQLSDVDLLANRNGDLFLPLAPAETSSNERVSSLVDLVNNRHGAETIRHGWYKPHHGFFEKG